MVDTGAGPVVAEARGDSTAKQRLLCPFDLQVWSVDRMLNFEITDHPQYQGLELQVFDDPAHGRGMAVLLRRGADGRMDIYTLIDPARFDIGPDGVDVEVHFADLAGRVIEVRIDDRDGRRRHRGTLLAPVGAVVEQPVSLALFLMGAASWCDGPAVPSTSASTVARWRPAACRAAGCTVAG